MRPRLRGIGSVSGSSAAIASAVGKWWVTALPSVAVTGLPYVRASRAATVRAPATETCWPMTARTAVSGPSTAPGTRMPGQAATSGASRGSVAEQVVDGGRVGVEVEQPAHPGHRGHDVARVGEGQVGRHVVAGVAQPDRRLAVRQQEGPAVRRRVALLDPGDGLEGEDPHHARRRRRAAGPAAAGTGARSRCLVLRTLRGGRPQLARRRGEHRPHRVVELPDAGEPRGERDLGERHLGGLDQDPGGVRPLRPGQRLGAGADLGGEQPVQLAVAVAQPRGQPAHAVAVDRPVGDQPHGAGDRVGADVPLGRAGGRVRAAAPAGAEAGLLGCRSGGVEGHVAAAWGSSRGSSAGSRCRSWSPP